jgi:hypothetical protein
MIRLVLPPPYDWAKDPIDPWPPDPAELLIAAAVAAEDDELGPML